MPGFTLPYWLSPGDDRPPQAIDDEIAEELRLHLNLLAEENERRGMATEEAKRTAAERFGDLDSISRRCRLIKQGDAPMQLRIQTTMIALLLVLASVAMWRVAIAAPQPIPRAMLDRLEMNAAQLERLQERLAMQQTPAPEYRVPLPAPAPDRAIPPVGEPSTAYVPGRGSVDMIHMGDGYFTEAVKASAAKLSDITGAVIDADGKPIADADVLLIVKTWPNFLFRQDDYTVKTDESGGFTLKGHVPLDGAYGINAVVAAPGHAIASHYVYVKDPAGEAPEPIEFALFESTPFRVRIVDEEGQPLAGARVSPSGRIDLEDNEHNVYFQGSEPLWRRTDVDGMVEIDWFRPHDIAIVDVRPRGDSWLGCRFEVPVSPEIVPVEYVRTSPSKGRTRYSKPTE